MRKTFLPGLLATALLSLTLTSCGYSATEGDDDVATAALPPLPAAPDTTKGTKKSEQFRELNSVNATEDIKKMQPQM